MTKTLSLCACALGAIAILWMGSTFLGLPGGANTLALMVTMVIALTYALGFAELLRYHRDTVSLQENLGKSVSDRNELNRWLATLPATLQTPVQIRVQGARAGLPTPVLTPYLVGLLVMLGLLGTFVGMVDTLRGAVGALEGSTELSAIRAGLAAPIQGLGLAFGTSVAGVAASAMLGLASTLCRRERMLAGQQLDRKCSADLQAFSAHHQQQQTFDALQSQANVLPQVAHQLQQLAEQLQSGQQQFFDQASQRYQELAHSVDQSLKDSIGRNSEQVVSGIAPVVEATMQSLRDQHQQSQQQLGQQLESQLGGLTDRFTETTRALQTQWQTGFDAQQNSMSQAQSDWQAQQSGAEQERLQYWKEGFSEITRSLQDSAQSVNQQTRDASAHMLTRLEQLQTASEAMLEQRKQTESDWLQQSARTLEQLQAVISEQLTKLHEAEAQRGHDAVTRLGELQQAVSSQLSTQLADLGAALEQPMARLMESASEAPKAAAQVIAQLQEEMAQNKERDQELLVERHSLLQQLDDLTANLKHSAEAQQQAIEQMTLDASGVLGDIGERLQQQLSGETGKLTDLIDHFSVSSAEMTGLTEGFGAAVIQFGESSQQLMQQLQQMQESLQQASNRSDEQLGYYVAQAREIIDHSMLSQQEMIEQMRSANSKKATDTTVHTETEEAVS